MTYRILITGARSWPEKHWENVRDTIYERIGWAALGDIEPPFVIVHGVCPDGADLYAERTYEWLMGHGATGVDIERYPANWKAFGRAAGIIRNTEMVDLGADVVLAFLMPCSKKNCKVPVAHESHGTTHCADFAEKSGLDVHRFRAKDFGWEVE